ncbi:MAG: hypothetical protein Q8O56_13505 [Solirubrobacteraceae bacterium]|nr:hypothetical protein [Solirubrobacteraceae bacterium]
MDEHEFRARMDRHHETIGDYMREGHELMARLDASLERVDASLERNTEAFLDLRSFLGQATDVLAALVREVGAGREAFVEETRAQRQALFAILDQLQRGTRPGDAPA